MLELEIPGWAPLRLEHLVLDLNGTLALDGELLPGVAERVEALSVDLELHLATADTHGRAAALVEGLPLQLALVERGQEAAQKLALVERLGAASCAVVGNGGNDAAALEAAALGVAVCREEGLARPSLLACDLLVPSVLSALDLFRFPRRLVATLRV